MGCEVWETMCNLAWRQFHTSSYNSRCQPGDGWLKSSWHIRSLMCSQAQMVSGKKQSWQSSPSKCSSPSSFFFFFYFSSLCVTVHVFSVRLGLPSPFIPPSCSHAELPGRQAPSKTMWTLRWSLLEFVWVQKPSTGAPYWGQRTQISFRPAVPLHGHLHIRPKMYF